MAIAFDATSVAAEQTSSPVTWSHTCTGSNRILWVGLGLGGTTGDHVTGVTYNGSAMTAGPKIQTPLDSFIYLYYLVAPSSGANTVSVSVSGTFDTIAGAVSYTGASQTGQPDSSNTNSASTVTTLVTSTTTVADNSWVVGVGSSSGGVFTSGAGTTNRQVMSVGIRANLVDSNAAKTPAGSYSMTFDVTSAARLATIMASFSPAGGAPSGPTNLKSLDTNVKANIKSYNTNVLANIKSIDTNA